MWLYYSQILDNFHINPFFQPVTSRPYNRIPSDNFPPTDIIAEILCIPFILLFCSIFLFAWDFFFPTNVELILWRVTSAFILAFGLVCGLYSLLCDKILLLRSWNKNKLRTLVEMNPYSRQSKGFTSRVSRLMAKMRNNSPAQDPNLEIPLRVLIPLTIICACYCLCRMYVLIEDVIGLRRLPLSAFEIVSWSSYVPHL